MYRYQTVDISVAVATENGLITPIVTKADSKVNNSLSYTSIVFSPTCFVSLSIQGRYLKNHCNDQGKN